MNIKNIILGIIISVIFVMFCAYGVNLLYDAPEYDNYCDDRPYIVDKNLTQQEINEKNQYYKECQEEYELKNENYSKNLFIISLVFSLIIITISTFVINVSSVSGGLMLGSLFFIIYGTGRYWRYMNDWIRFILLGVVLIILIYLGFRIAKKK